MSKVVTAQMIRDILTFKGPCSLETLLNLLNLEAEKAETLKMMLKALQNQGSIEYCGNSEKWKSLVELE